MWATCHALTTFLAHLPPVLTSNGETFQAVPAGILTTVGSSVWTSFRASASLHPDCTQPASRAETRPANTAADLHRAWLKPGSRLKHKTNPENKSLRSARKEEEEAFTSTSSITAPRETERHMTGGVGHMTPHGAVEHKYWSLETGMKNLNVSCWFFLRF